MDNRGAGHRINHVRYYSFSDLEKALRAVLEVDAKQKAVSELFS